MLRWILDKVFGGSVPSTAHKSRLASTQRSSSISVEFHANTAPSRSSILLKKATAKKKSGDLDKAVSLLREAYGEIARTGDIQQPATFLRLPMYLREAGRPSEAWAEFNAMLAGQYPLDMRDPEFASLWQSQIYDKMRLFLQKEKKNDQAVLFGVLSLLAYSKWLAYGAATEKFPELKKARRDEFREQTSPQGIQAAVLPLLTKAKLEQVSGDLTRVIRHHLKNGKSLNLAHACGDVRGALASHHPRDTC